MTKRQREILEATERGETSDGNRDVHSPKECQRFVPSWRSFRTSRGTVGLSCTSRRIT